MGPCIREREGDNKVYIPHGWKTDKHTVMLSPMRDTLDRKLGASVGSSGTLSDMAGTNKLFHANVQVRFTVIESLLFVTDCDITVSSIRKSQYKLV